jgi:molybdopterin-biosynthesis enzyme MoeA-like protein
MWEQFIRYDIRKHPKLKINLNNKEVYFVFPGIPRYYDKNKKNLLNQNTYPMISSQNFID